jgi:hypothetical protein
MFGDVALHPEMFGDVALHPEMFGDVGTSTHNI